MKNQALFSSKDKSKKLKCHLLQFLFGALKVNTTVEGKIWLHWKKLLSVKHRPHFGKASSEEEASRKSQKLSAFVKPRVVTVREKCLENEIFFHLWQCSENLFILFKRGKGVLSREIVFSTSPSSFGAVLKGKNLLP